MCALSPRCAGRCTDVAAPLQENVLRRGSQHYLPWRVRLPRSRVGLTTSPSEEASMLRIRNRAQFARRSYSGKKVRASGDARKHPRPRSVLGYFNSLLESKVGFWVATTVTAALMTPPSVTTKIGQRAVQRTCPPEELPMSEPLRRLFRQRWMHVRRLAFLPWSC